MLERLKSLFRSRGPEVEYERQGEPPTTVLPAGPMTGQMPTTAPRDDRAADANADDERS